MLADSSSRATNSKIGALLGALLLLAAGLSLSAPPAPAAAAEGDLPQYDGTVYRTDGVDGRVVSQGNPLVDAEVWDIEFIGNTAYVGGKFLRVVRALDGWDRVDQPFLAAFDGSTGRWVESFRPQLDGPVWALEQTPSGDLLVGGEFATVNGQTRRGLVALNPTTGAVSNRFGAAVDRPDTDLAAIVRDLKVRDNSLYVIGNFSVIDAPNRRMRVGKLARLDATTGDLDTTWTPTLSGRSGWAVDVSTDGRRVHLGGEFTYVNGTPGTSLYATVDSATGQLVPNHHNGFDAVPRWVWPMGGIVFDLAVSGDSVFLGQAEHSWEQRSSITGLPIGAGVVYHGLSNPNFINDTQVVENLDGRITIGCHCIRHSGYADLLVDGTTGQILQEITYDGVEGGDGLWAAALAPDQCRWYGGDFRTVYKLKDDNDGFARWAGRFIRLCPVDGPHPIPQGVADTVLVDSGAWWKVDTGATWPAGWQGYDTPDGNRVLDDAKTEFGYGDGDETTVVSDANRPSAIVARSDFQVDDPAAFNHLELNVAADDGASVWINGTAVAALRLPAGELTADTLATESVWGAAESDRQKFLIPTSMLRPGRNVIAASVHQGWAGSTDLSFDLQLIGAVGAPGRALDALPTLSVGAPVVNLRSSGDPLVFYDGDGQPAGDWTSVGYNDGAWKPGRGLVGLDDADIDTNLTPGRVAYYVRAKVDVANPNGLSATVTAQRDDGIIVYVNGTEIGRDNMPAGPVDATTLASSLLWGAAERETVSFPVPAGLLTAGTNVVAAEIHQGHVDSADAVVSLTMGGTR